MTPFQICLLIYLEFYLILGIAAYHRKVDNDVWDVIIVAIISGTCGFFLAEVSTRLIDFLNPLYTSEPYPRDTVYYVLFFAGSIVPGAVEWIELKCLQEEVRKCH